MPQWAFFFIKLPFSSQFRFIELPARLQIRTFLLSCPCELCWCSYSSFSVWITLRSAVGIHEIDSVTAKMTNLFSSSSRGMTAVVFVTERDYLHFYDFVWKCKAAVNKQATWAETADLWMLHVCAKAAQDMRNPRWQEAGGWDYQWLHL